MKFKSIIFIFGILFLLNGVSAKFLCGVLNDSDDGMSSAWFKVNVYDSSGKTGSCVVSPAGGKYCCDLDSIKSNWIYGETFYAESMSENYIAGPVNLSVTNNSYDLFPEMHLEKVIKVNSPSKYVYIQNNSSVYFDFFVKTPYSNISLNGNYITGLSFSDFVNASFGVNKFNIIANGNNKTFSENISFIVLSNFSASREFTCDDCSGKKIRENKNLSVLLNVNFSDYMENVSIYEYVPKNWKLLNFSGEIDYSEIDYNILIWNFSGKEFNETYFVNVPSISGNSEFFNFILNLEGEKLLEENILIYKFVPVSFGGKKSSGGNHKYVPKEIQSIGPTLPFVENKNENFKMAIYPKYTGYAGAELTPNNFSNLPHSSKVINSYAIQSTISSNEIQNISFEFKINKSLIQNKDKLKFLGLENNSWIPISGKVVSENEETISFGVFSGPINGFVVLEDEDKINSFNFYERVKSFFKKIFSKF